MEVKIPKVTDKVQFKDNRIGTITAINNPLWGFKYVVTMDDDGEVIELKDLTDPQKYIKNSMEPNLGERVTFDNGATARVTRVSEILEGCKYEVDLLFGERIEAAPLHEGPVRPVKIDYVYVVTDTEAGWNCVRGVYATLQSAVEANDGIYVKGKECYSYELGSKVIHEQSLEN